MSKITFLLFTLFIAALLGGYLCNKIVYPQLDGKHFCKIISKQCKYAFMALALPASCALIYTFSPLESAFSLVLIGLIGYLLNIVFISQVSRANDLLKKTRRQSEFPKTSILYLSIFIKYASLYLVLIIVFKTIRDNI